MKKFFDKTKTYNYILAITFFVISLIFLKQLSFALWKFDLLNQKHILAFLKMISNGKAFLSGKYLSFIFTFVGMVCVIYSGIILALNIEIGKKKEKIEETIETENSKPQENTTEEKIEVVEEVKEPVKEDKFAMYNIPTEEPVQPVTEVIAEPVKKEISQTLHLPEKKEEKIEVEVSEDEDKERERLQAKIKEIMSKMKEKQEEEKQEISSAPKEKILEPVKFDNGKPVIDMNFKNISEEENNLMEKTLIGAGFKLLSEIRIGSTGIDYLGVAKDKLAIVQLDTTSGNWFASEDKVQGQNVPVWFSEEGNKISPVARVVEAKQDIENLIKGQIDLPIETVVCLTNSQIVNYYDNIENWEKENIKIARLNIEENPEIGETFGTNLPALNEIYPIQSQEETSEADMNKLISILEKAEIPE